MTERVKEQKREVELETNWIYSKREKKKTTIYQKYVYKGDKKIKKQKDKEKH